MEIDLGVDALQFGHDVVPFVEGAAGDDLIAKIKKVQDWVLLRLEQIKTAPRQAAVFDLDSQKKILVKFLKSLPGGNLSDHCCMIWGETERMFARIDRQTGLSPQQIESQKQMVLEGAQRQIGQTIFIAQQLPYEAGLALASVSPARGVQEQFSKTIKLMVDMFRSFWEFQNEGGIENADQSLSFRVAREIAKVLLTPQGQLNIAIIPDLKAAFIPTQRQPWDYEVVISRLLDLIDSSWQPLLDAVVKPNNTASNAATAIRVDLGLAPNIQLQDLHAKQAVLAALLSHHSQGSAGDSFAAALSVRLQNEFLQNALKQYGELLHYGSIAKTIHGNPDRFFFKNSIASIDLYTPLVIDAMGRLPSGLPIWSAPSLKFSLQQMGIKNPSILANAALQILGVTSGMFEKTPDDVIRAFAQASLSVLPQANLENQIALGRYGFSTIDNRVLRAFEAAVKGVAEARRGVYAYNDLLESVRQPLKKTYQLLANRYHPSIVNQFQAEMEKSLYQRIRYVYNAAMPRAAASKGEYPTVGGFELYDRHPSDPYQIGTRIITPLQFQQLLLDTAQKTAQSSSCSVFQRVATAVSAIIQRNDFMKQVLVAYDSSNGANPDPVANYQMLSRTPMTSEDGEKPAVIEQADLGVLFSPDIRKVQINNAEDLLSWILGLLRWEEKTAECLETTFPHSIDSAAGESPSFNLFMNEEEKSDYLKSALSPQTWVHQRLYEPGRQIASWQADLKTKMNYLKAVEELLEKDAPQIVMFFQQASNGLLSPASTLAQFSASVLKILTQQMSGVDPAHMALACDALLLQNLPYEIVHKLQQSAVRFAASSIGDGAKGVYFCSYFNPRTQELSLGILDEDRKALSPIDEAFWDKLSGAVN